MEKCPPQVYSETKENTYSFCFCGIFKNASSRSVQYLEDFVVVRARGSRSHSACFCSSGQYSDKI